MPWPTFFMNYVKWLCWQKGCKLPFESRWVFAVCCDLYFRQKKMPSLLGIKKGAGVRHAVANRCLAQLTEEGLLQNGVPQYQPDTFLQKSNFIIGRWWKGLHYRKVEISPLGKRCAVLHAFIVRANAKKAHIGPRYLMACTGMPKRTVNHALDRLIRANKLKKDGLTLVALIEKEGVSMTVLDNQTLQIKMMLEGCYDRNLRKVLVGIGMKAYTILFKAHQRLSKANGGKVSFPHLLNSIKQQHPDSVAESADFVAAV